MCGRREIVIVHVSSSVFSFLRTLDISSGRLSTACPCAGREDNAMGYLAISKHQVARDRHRTCPNPRCPRCANTSTEHGISQRDSNSHRHFHHQEGLHTGFVSLKSVARRRGQIAWRLVWWWWKARPPLAPRVGRNLLNPTEHFERAARGRNA